MQHLNYTIGTWHAEACLELLDPGKLLAVISLTDGRRSQTSSRHTVVFEHDEGADAAAETEALVRRLLHQYYGI
jgi:hypothetical protein